MIGNLPAVYLARMDVEREERPFFMDWYERKHGPDLIRVGFYSAQAYHSVVGSPLICNVYEIASSEIFYTGAYQEARTPEQDPERPRILRSVSNRSNTVYEQFATAGVALPEASWGEGIRTGGIRAPVISTTRFETPPACDDAVRKWHADAEFVRLSAQDGFESARLCRQAGRLHPANPSNEPRWMLLTEWRDLEAAESDGTASEVSRRLTDAPFSAVGVQYNLARLVTSLRDSAGG